MPLIYTWWLLVFLIGMVVGSALNVLIYRVAFGKSAWWPASRCFTCFSAIRPYHNIPILGYMLLGGKCRVCKTPYSIHYVWTELGVGLLFAAMFYLDIHSRWQIQPAVWSVYYLVLMGAVPVESWLMLFYHCFWLSLAWIALGSARLTGTIPHCYGVIAGLMGLAVGLLMPWPWPTESLDLRLWLLDVSHGPIWGMQPRPILNPPPTGLSGHTAWLGISVALAGACIGWLALRFLGTTSGVLAFGVGMGAMMGWQMTLVSLITAAGLGWGKRPLAVRLPLAMLLVILAWPWLGATMWTLLRV